MTRRHALMLTLLALAAAVGALVTPACGNDRPECTTICDTLQACGMLPSPLGTADNEGLANHSDHDNCLARCNATSLDEIRQLESCMPSIGANTDLDGVWCSSGDCTVAASCLEDFYGDERIAGVGRGAASVSLIDAVDGKVTLLDSQLVTCATSTLDPAIYPVEDYVYNDDNEGIEAFCEKNYIERIDVLLETTDAIQVLATGSCIEVLERNLSTDFLLVGRYQLALKVYQGHSSDDTGSTDTGDSDSGSTDTGDSDSGDSGDSEGQAGKCNKFYGQSIVISAGASPCKGGDCSGVIVLPKNLLECMAADSTADVSACRSRTSNCGYPCENGPNACINTCADVLDNPDKPSSCSESTLAQSVDDDCNGLSNCNDPACAVECTETGPRCSDDIDNDKDGLVDCDDHDCDDEPACGGDSTSETSGDSGTDTTETGDSGTDTTGTDTTG